MEWLYLKEIDKKEVLRYLGCKPGVYTKDEALEKKIDRAGAEVLESATVRAVYARFALSGEGGLLAGGELLSGNDIFAHLRGCCGVVLMALTLGDGVERKIRAAQAQSALYATVMDCCASVAAEQFSDLYEEKLRRQFMEKGEFLTGRFSPGYGDFPIEKQHVIQRLLDTRRKIGLGVTDSSILIPRKSVTAVLGVADKPVTGRLAGCRNCLLKEKCNYRKEGTSCV